MLKPITVNPMWPGDSFSKDAVRSTILQRSGLSRCWRWVTTRLFF